MDSPLGRLLQLGAAPPPDLRAGRVAKGRIGERLQVLVQRLQLIRHPLGAVGRIEPLVERAQLRGDPVEAVKDCVELPIVEGFPLVHALLC